MSSFYMNVINPSLSSLSVLSSGAWIGLNDIEQKSSYHWIATNESLGSWTSWTRGQPGHADFQNYKLTSVSVAVKESQ